MAEKVTLQPCLAQDKLSVIARQACYAVHEDFRPETTVLGCAPALNAKVQEDIDFIQLYPVITIESCEKDCAAKLVEKMGQKAAVVLRMPEVAADLGLNMENLQTERIDCEDAAVQAVAKKILAEVDRLLQEA